MEEEVVYENSYFANIGNTFYAGPNGTSFEIKASFGNKQELDQDAADYGSSIVRIGEYVTINYGDKNYPNATTENHPEALGPNGENYNHNRTIDETGNENIYYNATLWQKDSHNSYKLIFHCSSAEPDITIREGEEAYFVDPGATFSESVFIEKDISSTPIDQKFNLFPIKPWNITKGSDSVVRNPDELPSVEINTEETSGATSSTTTKYLHFGIPKAWDIKKGTEESVYIGPAEDASVIIDNYSVYSIDHSQDEPSVDTKYVHFRIPNAWKFEIGSGTTVDPSVSPSVTIDNNNDNTTKLFHFNLPKPWAIEHGTGLGINGSDIVAPNSKLIGVQIDGYETYAETHTDAPSSDIKYLHFGIPAPWDFSIAATQYVAANSDPAVAMLDPLPESPTVKRLQFTLPANIRFNSFTATKIGSSDSPSIVSSTSGEYRNEINLNFNVPGGTNIVAGTALSALGRDGAIGNIYIVASQTYTGAANIKNNNFASFLNGDIYIDSVYGVIYKFSERQVDANNVWQYSKITKQGNIQLPVPDIQTTILSPYTSEGVVNTPSAVVTYDGLVNSTWGINFRLPKAPNFINKGSRFLPSTEKGSISINQVNDNIEYTILIPKGTSLSTGPYSQRTDGTHSKEAGDLYLTSDTKTIYRYKNTNELDENFAISLNGESFSIFSDNNGVTRQVVYGKSDFAGEEYSELTNIVDKLATWLDNNLQGVPARRRQVVDVFYRDALRPVNVDDVIESELDVSYWFYLNDDDQWYAIKITSDGGAAILNNNNIWTTNDDLGTAYSVKQVNVLRNRVLENGNTLSTLTTAVNNRPTSSEVEALIEQNSIEWGSWS